MLQDFSKHLYENLSYLVGKNLLLAVSGGVDSMVLLDLFRSLDMNISVAHCNFNLRKNASDLDEALVHDYCEKFNIKYFVNSFKTEEYASLNKQSIQIAARELRYDWFNDLCNDNAFDYILTAHHLDDSVETFLINFTRGTGIDGLLGIPEKNQITVRPLLPFSRERIFNFAVENNIVWREDASNATTKYLRNKIRHEIVPVLKSQNAEFLSSFKQTVSNLSDANLLIKDACEFVSNQVFIDSDHVLELDINKLKTFKNYNLYLYQWLKAYEFKNWHEVYDLLNAETGKKILSRNYILLKNRNSLILENRKMLNSSFFLIFEDDKSLFLPISLIFERFESDNLNTLVLTKNEIIVDASQIIYPLKLRKWQLGDVFHPIGMKGKKKVSKYFKDQKFSQFDKEDTWILENGNQEIIWIVGHRMDERFKILNNTTNKLKIELLK